MPTTVKTGWLKDKNGDKFAPKTLTSQVQTNDGVLLEDSMSAIASGAADDALLEANQYTDGKIALLMNNSSEAVDSIMELATAMKENDEVVGALEEAIGKKANSGDLTSHTSDKNNPHEVTKAQVGLGNVPNVATNDQTPTYSEATALANLTSGEKLSISLGKIMKAIKDFISHKGDTTAHITSDERTKWNTAKTHADSAHAPSDAEKNVQSDWNESNKNSDAFIKNKPTIPTTASDVGAVPTTRKVNNKALSADISLTASDVGAATTNDITNAINALDSTVSAETGKYISAITQTNGKITATKASLPTIPTVNNATLTIQKNGTNVATFTANSATNATANITVPTGAAADKGVDTSISASSTSTNLPTSKAVATFVEGKGYKTTDNNTTYTVATGDGNGQIKVTPSSGSAYNVSVKGLGSAAFTEFSAYEASGSAGMALSQAKTYTDDAVAQKSQVVIKTWTVSDV